MNFQKDEKTDSIFEEHLEKLSKDRQNESIQEFETLKLLASAIKETDIKGALYPFGSFCNGFQSNTGDLDCVLITEDEKLDGKKILQQIAGKIQKLGNSNIEFQQLKVKQRILFAKVPIIKLRDEKNNVEIDLSVNNVNGLANTRLLYEFSQLHPKISQLGKLLKLWGKGNKIIVTGFVTSYSMILLMIHFLQAKYDVPQLEYKNLSDKQVAQLEQVENNPFFVINQSVKLEKLSTASLENLMKDFFEYYEPNGEFEKKKICVSLSSDKKQNLDYRRTIKIQDPINKRNDPSKNFKKECYFLQDSFLEAKNLIIEKSLDLFTKKKKKQKQKQKQQQNNEPTETKQQQIKKQKRELHTLRQKKKDQKKQIFNDQKLQNKEQMKQNKKIQSQPQSNKKVQDTESKLVWVPKVEQPQEQ